MLKSKRILSIVFVILLLPTLSYAVTEDELNKYYPPFIKEQYKARKEVPIRLKIDKYYILYTNPYGPYIDNGGNMIVSMKMVEDLLGGNVIYTKGSQKATIELYGTMMELTVNSDKVKINGEEQTMPKIAKPYKDSLLIPLKLILTNTDIQHSYDSKYNQIHITDPRVTIKDIVKYAEVELDNDPVIDHAIQLIKYNFNSNKIGNMITGANVSGRTLLKGESEIRTQKVHYNPDGSIDGDFTLESDNYSKATHEKLPLVKNGEHITREALIGSSGAEYIGYIFATGRIFPDFNE